MESVGFFILLLPHVTAFLWLKLLIILWLKLLIIFVAETPNYFVAETPNYSQSFTEKYKCHVVLRSRRCPIP